MDDYKIVIIHGMDEEERGFYDGQIEYYGKVEDDYFHNVYLLNYAKEHYPDIKIFSQLNPRYPKEVVAYFLAKMGHIIFFNTTKYDDNNLKKYGKFGMFMMPDYLTEKQQSSLIEFSKTISDFDILVSYDLEIKDGLLDSKTYQKADMMDTQEFIQKYINQVMEKSTMKK